MMKKTVTERIKKARTYQTQQRVLSEWADGWEADLSNVIDALNKAIDRGDHERAAHMVARLDGMRKKRFTALNNVLRILSDPERRLIDLEAEGGTGESGGTGEPEEKEESADAGKEIPQSLKGKIQAAQDAWRPTEGIDMEEIVKGYKGNMSVQEIAAYNGINHNKVIKILVTAGVYSSETYDHIKDLREKGKSEEEIMEIVGIGATALNNYTPYKKGPYGPEPQTENARRIRECREKKKQENG